MKYLIFGLQRSGTNYLQQLIDKNFHSTNKNQQHSLWKHSIDFPRQYEFQYPAIVIYKNPYTWIESIIFRNSVDWFVSQFEYDVFENSNPKLLLGEKHINVLQMAKYYKHFNRTWIFNNSTDLHRTSYHLKYEDLLMCEKREKILEQIQQKFGFIRRNQYKWINPEKGKISQSRDYDKERELYYLSMKPQYMSVEQIDAVSNYLRFDIKRLGYSIPNMTIK